MRDSGLDDLGRCSGSAHQLGDDIHIRSLEDLAPVGGSEDRAQRLWNRLRSDAAAADGRDSEPESQFEGDLIGRFGKYGQRTRAHVAETDNPHTDFFHMDVL